MDDFKPQQPDQPTQSGDNNEPQKPYQDNPVTYETTAVEQPVQSDETTAAAPVVAAPKKSGLSKWLLGFIVVLLLAGVGAFGYWQWTEAQNARSEVTSLRTSLENTLKEDKTDQTPVEAPATTEQAIKQAAKAYYCNLADFGCDKVQATLTKQLIGDSATNPSFAIVKAGDSLGGAVFYLKSIDNKTWVVIFDGQNTPPADIVKKFAIPANIATAS